MDPRLVKNIIFQFYEFFTIKNPQQLGIHVSTSYGWDGFAEASDYGSYFRRQHVG